MKTSLNNTTSCKREAKIRKFRRSDQQQCRHLYEVSRALFGSSRIHYWILCEKYVQYSTGCGLMVVLLSSLYSIWILLLYLLLVLACTIHDFANVTLAMPDGFDRVAPSPSWGHRVVSNNKQKFNNEVECKMCSK